jgi:hypothetical protein
MTPEIIQTLDSMKSYPILMGIMIAVFVMIVALDTYNKYFRPKKDEAEKMPHFEKCSEHGKLEIQLAVMLEKIGAVHDWTQRSDAGNEKKFEDLSYRLRKLEARVGLVEQMQHIEVITDDTKS